jgi:Serine phosphatase RsbU, regulator of sigma subunit
VLYTDGITEAENPEGEEYGVERLRELCRRHAGDDPDTLAAGIEAHLDAFARGTPYLDDRTVVILRRE